MKKYFKYGIIFVLIGLFIFCLWAILKTPDKLSPMKEKDIVSAATEIDYSFIETNYPQYKDEIKKNKETEINLLTEIYKITNSYRNETDVPTYELDPTLCMLASIRAQEIKENKKFSHNRPNNLGYFSTLFNEYGLSKGNVGENIAWGYNTAIEVCEGWKNSQSHYENILNPAYTKVGFGIAVQEDGTYVVVQEFMDREAL